MTAELAGALVLALAPAVVLVIGSNVTARRMPRAFGIAGPLVSAAIVAAVIMAAVLMASPDTHAAELAADDGMVRTVIAWVGRALVDVLAAVDPAGECVRFWDAAAAAFVACVVPA